MGLLQQLYINSSSFALATAVYTDQALTTLAPDGFYSMDGIVREQVGGVLGRSELCEACAPNCDANEIIYIINDTGEYEYDVYVGDTLGAVRVHVNTLGGAAGFSASYASTVYNDIYTRNLGLLETTSSSGVTYIGDSSTFTTSGSNITRYNYGGGEWIADGNVTINPFSGSNLTNSVYHGGGVITFPKIAGTVNTATLKIRMPFANSSASFRVECSAPLPGFNSSQAPQSESATACGQSTQGAFYASVVNGSVSPDGTTATVAIGDLVFNDPFALTPVSNGWYAIDAGAMEITNGVITDISDCAE